MTTSPRHLPPEALNEWLAAAAAELDLEAREISIGALLNLARDVAHDVARPAAPLTTFLLGIAVGRASDDPEAFTRLAARLSERAARWDADHPE